MSQHGHHARRDDLAEWSGRRTTDPEQIVVGEVPREFEPDEVDQGVPRTQDHEGLEGSRSAVQGLRPLGHGKSPQPRRDGGDAHQRNEPRKDDLSVGAANESAESLQEVTRGGDLGEQRADEDTVQAKGPHQDQREDDIDAERQDRRGHSVARAAESENGVRCGGTRETGHQGEGHENGGDVSLAVRLTEPGLEHQWSEGNDRAGQESAQQDDDLLGASVQLAHAFHTLECRERCRHHGEDVLLGDVREGRDLSREAIRETPNRDGVFSEREAEHERIGLVGQSVEDRVDLQPTTESGDFA